MFSDIRYILFTVNVVLCRYVFSDITYILFRVIVVYVSLSVQWHNITFVFTVNVVHVSLSVK